MLLKSNDDIHKILHSFDRNSAEVSIHGDRNYTKQLP